MDNSNTEGNSALQFLRKYQEAYSSVTSLRYKISKKEVAKNWDELLEDEELVKKFKHKHNLSSIEEIKKLILSPVKEDDYIIHLSKQIVEYNKPFITSEIKNTPVGTLPTNDFNASAILTPNEEKVIVINSGIVAFLSEVINSFLGNITTSFLTPQWPFEEAAIRIIQWTKAIASGVAEFGLSKTPIFSDPTLMMASGSVNDTAQVFILSHEYSHFILGHFDDSSTIQRRLVPDKKYPTIEFYLRQQKQEFEADLKGVELTIEWCKKTHHGNYQITFLSVALIFHLLDLIELFGDTVEEAMSHPPALIRRKSFEEHYQDQFDEEIIKEIDYLDSFMNKVKLIAEKFVH